MDARTVRIGFMNTGTTRSIANGAARQATGMGARMVRIGCTGMVRVVTSASGADRPQTARVAHTPLRTAMKSDDYGQLAEQRAEVAEALRLALGELESGNELSGFIGMRRRCTCGRNGQRLPARQGVRNQRLQRNALQPAVHACVRSLEV